MKKLHRRKLDKNLHLKNVKSKGADYLVCYIPFWEPTGEKKDFFYKEWPCEIFPDAMKISESKNEWKLPDSFRKENNIPDFLKGFYSIYGKKYLKFVF